MNHPSEHSPIDQIKFIADKIRLGTVKFVTPAITQNYLYNAIKAAQIEFDLLATPQILLPPEKPKLKSATDILADSAAPKPPPQPTIPRELHRGDTKKFQQLTNEFKDLESFLIKAARNRKIYAEPIHTDLKWKERHLQSELKLMRSESYLKTKSSLKAYFDAHQIYEAALKEFVRPAMVDNQRLIDEYQNAQFQYQNAQLALANRNITLSAIETAKGYLTRINRNFHDGSLTDHKWVNWDFLPAGKWSPNKVVEYFRKLSNRKREYHWDLERLDYILSLNPQDCYLGKEEFDGYAAFTFTWTTKAVLEHPVYGHAIYVFFSDWKSLSGLTKMQLLTDYSGEIQRIIHTGEWKYKLKSCLTRV